MSKKKNKSCCDFCDDPFIFQVPDPNGRIKRFCEACLLALATEAVRILGHRLAELLP